MSYDIFFTTVIYHDDVSFKVEQSGSMDQTAPIIPILNKHPRSLLYLLVVNSLHLHNDLNYNDIQLVNFTENFFASHFEQN